MNPTLQILSVGLIALMAVAAVALARRERRRHRQLRLRLLEVARHLARRDFGHTIEARTTGELAEIARAFDSASAILRRHSQRTQALLDLDLALLLGPTVEHAVVSILPAIATALQCRSVSIVLLAGAAPGQARSFDFLTNQPLNAEPRSVILNAQQLRTLPAGSHDLDANAVGLNGKEFLGPLARSGARAFRFCTLASGGQICGFLCIGYRLSAHDSDDADIDADLIAERLSLGLARHAHTRNALAGAIIERSPLESDLHRALQCEEFALVYQPIVEAGSLYCAGVEALLRWPHGNDGAVRSAAEFVPVAEQSGLIVDLGDWVLRTVCLQIESWRRHGLDLDYVAVNLSARQLRNAGLLPTVLGCLRRSGMEPAQLQLEFSAKVLVDDPELLLVLEELARRGVRLALDDFGVGGVTPGALHDLPIDTIKIDHSCIAAMHANSMQRTIVEAAIGMGAASHWRVIAEGVEQDAQRRFLEAAGCDAMQGYLFAPPLPPADLELYLRAQRPRLAGIAARAA